MNQDNKARLKNLLRRVNKARNFPTNTCPASRHAQMLGETLAAGESLTDDREHSGESILATVAALYEARTERDRLRAAIQQTLDENCHLADGENCTLIALKRSLKTVGAPWDGEVSTETTGSAS